VSSQITAITNDGLYAVGYDGGGTSDRAFLWKASTPSVVYGPMVAGSYMSEAHGIGYRTVGGVKQLVMGGKQSSAQVGMFISSNDGSTWTRPYASSGTAPGTAFSNTVGGNGASDTAWMAWTEGTSSYSVTRIYGASSNGTATKSATTAVYAQGVSNTGRAACARKDSSGTKQNVYLDFTTDGGTAAQNIFAGLDGTLHGVASAMAGNGTAVFGQSPITGSGATNYPYKYTVGGSSAALPLLPGTTGSVSLGYIYGASLDGRYAVGMDFRGMEKATLWDTVRGTVIDLTDYATAQGILGDFTLNLRRAYTIGRSGNNLVIGGMGVNTAVATRGFILTIPMADAPEPATMAFLALGGLALLRRRR
jgi:hypothetical protein